MENAFEQTIRDRAYAIWLAAGMSGDAEHHWLDAERSILDEASAAGVPAAGASTTRKSATKNTATKNTVTKTSATKKSATKSPSVALAPAKKTLASKATAKARPSLRSPGAETGSAAQA